MPVFDWQDLIEHGDVVLFRFPVAEEDGHCTEKPKANRGHEVRVTQRASCQAAGLNKLSRFACARRRPFCCSRCQRAHHTETPAQKISVRA